MRRTVISIFLHVVLPLVIGFLIYFFFRPHYWFVELFGRRSPVADASQLNRFQKILIYSIPDACWAYSFSAVLFVWGGWQGPENKYFPVLIFLLVVLSELVQLVLTPRFTFDWPDLVAAILGWGLSYLLVYRYEKN